MVHYLNMVTQLPLPLNYERLQSEQLLLLTIILFR